MQKIIKGLDLFVSKFWLFFCLVIFLVAMVIKAEYSFADYPYFSVNTGLDIIMLLGIILLYYYIFCKSDWIEENIKMWMLWAFFGTFGVAFVFLVPVKPFSDMQYVTEGALLFSKWDLEQILESEYLQKITKNLKVSIFYGIFASILPKNIFSIRIVNVLFYLLIAHFMSKISNNLGFKCPKFVFVVVATYLPMFLYCNHVYFDLPTLLMCALAVYFYTKEDSFKNMLLTGVFLGVGSTLRVLAYLVFVAILIDYIFKHSKEKFEMFVKQIGIVIAFTLITFGIPKICDIAVNEFFRMENAEDESIWNLFYMGINEYEFGFMCNEISGPQRDFEDFYELLTSRDLEQNAKLFSRKIFWTWSQGTYQAQRYAFGYEVENELDKFEYTTPLTGILLKDDYIVRQFINILCRAQYFALFFFMILGLFGLKEDGIEKYRFLIYLMFGTFLILIFYEMKSRYLMHCLVPMVMLALRGLSNLRTYYLDIRSNV